MLMNICCILLPIMITLSRKRTCNGDPIMLPNGIINLINGHINWGIDIIVSINEIIFNW